MSRFVFLISRFLVLLLFLNRDSPVQLGDFLSELQNIREDRRRREKEQEEETEEQLSSKALTARLAAKELETLQVITSSSWLGLFLLII